MKISTKNRKDVLKDAVNGSGDTIERRGAWIICWLTMVFILLSVGMVSAVDIDSCMNITSPGVYTLTTDLEISDYVSSLPPGSGRYCFSILSDDVTLDCQGHEITCEDETFCEPSTITVIRSTDPHNNTRVINCRAEFSVLLSGNEVLIKNNTFRTLTFKEGSRSSIIGNNISSLSIGGSTTAFTETEPETIPPSVTDINVSNNQLGELSITLTVDSLFENNSISPVETFRGGFVLIRSNNNRIYNNEVTSSSYGLMFYMSNLNHIRDNQVCGNSVDYLCSESVTPIIDEGNNFGDIIDGCTVEDELGLHDFIPITCGVECTDNDVTSPYPHMISSYVELVSYVSGDTWYLHDYCDASSTEILHEAVCGESDRYETIDCTEEYGEGYICDAGRCVYEAGGPACMCAGDLGNDPYHPGVCEYSTETSSETYVDTCISGTNNLIEYYCEGDAIASENYDCEDFGMICTTDLSGVGYCAEDIEICIDSDGGGDDQQYYGGFVNFEDATYSDVCLDSSTLQEYYCEPGLGVSYTTYSCPCVTDEDGYGHCECCMDDDPDNDVHYPGTCLSLIYGTENHDSCPSLFSSNIYEYSCTLTGSCQRLTYDCPAGELCLEASGHAICCDTSELWDSILSGGSSIDCSDSDGRNYLIRGTIHSWGHSEDGVCGMEGGGDFDETLMDTCVDSSGEEVTESPVLREFFCNEETVFLTTYRYPDSELISCEDIYGPGSICRNGSCVSTECTDTDATVTGSFNIYLGGEADNGTTTCEDYCIDLDTLHECYCSPTGEVLYAEITCDDGCNSSLNACNPISVEFSCTEISDEANDVHVPGSVLYTGLGTSSIYYDFCGDDMFSVEQVGCSGTDVVYESTPCPAGEHCELDDSGIGVCVPGTCVDSDGGYDLLEQGECTDVYGIHEDSCDEGSTSVIEWYCDTDNLCHNITEPCPSGVCYSGRCMECNDPDGDDITIASTCTSTLVNLTDVCTGLNTIQEAECFHGTCTYVSAKSCPPRTQCFRGACTSLIGPSPLPLPKDLWINKTPEEIK